MLGPSTALTQNTKATLPAQSIALTFSHAVLSPLTWTTLTLAIIKAAAKAIMGTCIQKAARQPKASAIAPPTTAPTAAPAPKRTLTPP